MLFFSVLLLFFGLLYLPSILGVRRLKSVKDKARTAMALAFILSGSFHFIDPGQFVAMMPPFLPAHLELVYISGIFEILGGLGLLIPRTQGLAAYGLLALLVAVFPANIYVAVANVDVGGMLSDSIYQWIRLPFQAVYIWWLLWSSGVGFPVRFSPSLKEQEAAA